MIIKVTKRYVDKYTKKIVEEGTETEMTAERGKELIKEGVAKEVKVTGKEVQKGGDSLYLPAMG